LSFSIIVVPFCRAVDDADTKTGGKLALAAAQFGPSAGVYPTVDEERSRREGTVQK
jgi:hypothetical protein